MSTITWPSTAGLFAPASSQTRPVLGNVRPGCGESVDDTGDCAIGGHRAEHIRFGLQHVDVDQTAPAECDGQGHIRQDLPGSCMAGPLRHGVSATDIAVFRRDLLTISASSSDAA
ncbi:hypothetical protein GCM10027028_34800 [Streptomyces sundarbansensis]